MNTLIAAKPDELIGVEEVGGVVAQSVADF